MMPIQWKKTEEWLSEFPLCQYALEETKNIPFSSSVREICEKECPRYGKSWSCPPAVGSVDECRENIQKYSHAFVFITAWEVDDAENMDLLLQTRKEHEAVVRPLLQRFRQQYGDQCQAFSSESCEKCQQCTWPDHACRFPEWMIPCLEGQGIVVVNLAENLGIPTWLGPGLVTWFGMILF